MILQKKKKYRAIDYISQKKMSFAVTPLAIVLETLKQRR